MKMDKRMTKEATLGRPPKPEHLKRKNRVVILLTDDEIIALDSHISERGFADRNDFGRTLILKEIDYKRMRRKADGGD